MTTGQNKTFCNYLKTGCGKMTESVYKIDENGKEDKTHYICKECGAIK